MQESKAAWEEVGNRFGDLGQHIKNRYDATIAFGDDDRAKVDDAVRSLVDALDTTFTAIGDSLRDPNTRDQLKGTASALGDALTTTFREVADEIGSRIPGK